MKKKTISVKELRKRIIALHDKYFKIANGDTLASETQRIMACGAMDALSELNI